jgi:hypothetical protein
LRATPTILSQNPLLPTTANLLVPSCPALLASPLLLTSLLPSVLPFLLLLPSFTFLRAVVSSALIASNFAIFVFPASPLLPFVAFPMPLVPCRPRLCPAPLSVRAQLPRAAQGQTHNRAWPRGPRCPSFSCRAYPQHCAPFASPAISVVLVPPSFPYRARRHCVQLHPLLRDQTSYA